MNQYTTILDIIVPDDFKVQVGKEHFLLQQDSTLFIFRPMTTVLNTPVQSKYIITDYKYNIRHKKTPVTLKISTNTFQIESFNTEIY